MVQFRNFRQHCANLCVAGIGPETLDRVLLVIAAVGGADALVFSTSLSIHMATISRYVLASVR